MHTYEQTDIIKIYVYFVFENKNVIKSKKLLKMFLNLIAERKFVEYFNVYCTLILKNNIIYIVLMPDIQCKKVFQEKNHVTFS